MIAKIRKLALIVGYRRFWFFLLIAAFVVRAGVAFYWNARVERGALVASSSDLQTPASLPAADVPRDGPFFFGDSDSYWKLARALAFGRPYRFDPKRNWEIFRTPGYPALLAPLFWSFGENPPILAARFLGVAFGVANVALVGALAFAYFRRRSVATLAGVFVAFDPTLVLQSVLILSEEPFLTFALLQHWTLLTLARRLGFLQTPENDAVFRQSRRSIATLTALLGLTTAATVYLRPSWLYFAPFFALIVAAFAIFNNIRRLSAFFNRSRLFETAFVAVGAVVVFEVALFPWAFRNYRLCGKYLTTSLQMGASLYDGLSPTATGASDMSFVDDFRRRELESPSGPLDEHFELRLDRRLKTASLDWVRANPDAAVELAFVKFARLWSPIPREPAFSAPPLKLALFVSFAPVLLGGLCGFFRSLRRRGAAWTLLIPALYVTSLHVVFVSSIRYRTPVLYGFSILTAFVAVRAFESFRARKKRQSRSTA